MTPRPRRGAPSPDRPEDERRDRSHRPGVDREYGCRADQRGASMRVSPALAALAVLAASVLVVPLAPAAGAGPVERGDPEAVTAIAVQAPGPPHYVVGDDRRKHIE